MEGKLEKEAEGRSGDEAGGRAAPVSARNRAIKGSQYSGDGVYWIYSVSAAAPGFPRW